MIDLEVIVKANVKARGWLETGSGRSFRLLPVECQPLQRPAMKRDSCSPSSHCQPN